MNQELKDYINIIKKEKTVRGGYKHGIRSNSFKLREDKVPGKDMKEAREFDPKEFIRRIEAEGGIL